MHQPFTYSMFQSKLCQGPTLVASSESILCYVSVLLHFLVGFPSKFVGMVFIITLAELGRERGMICSRFPVFWGFISRVFLLFWPSGGAVLVSSLRSMLVSAASSSPRLPSSGPPSGVDKVVLPELFARVQLHCWQCLSELELHLLDKGVLQLEEGEQVVQEGLWDTKTGHIPKFAHDLP